MPAHHFDLVSQWRLAAPVERVWSALAEPESWPRWWPYVCSVRTLRAGGDGGLGAVRRIQWATRLPYRIVIDVETVEVVPHQRMRARSSGHLHGEGIWLLRCDDRFTDVTYVWRVAVDKPWMRWLAPILAPVFRWNHRGVMRAGGEGLARHLRGEAGASHVVAGQQAGSSPSRKG
jgi:Polyketide cyclase / dehydrase and lipid transport